MHLQPAQTLTICSFASISLAKGELQQDWNSKQQSSHPDGSFQACSVFFLISHPIHFRSCLVSRTQSGIALGDGADFCAT